MAADLQMHVITSDQDVLDYKLAHKNTIGSQYENIDTSLPDKEKLDKENKESTDALVRLEQTPSVWLGTLSWLKAAISEDDSEYVPDVLMQVHELVGEHFPKLDDELIEQIVNIWESGGNDTSYDVADLSMVKEFLLENKGSHVFTMTW